MDIYVYHELGLQFIPELTHDGNIGFEHNFIWASTDGTVIDQGITGHITFTIPDNASPAQLRNAITGATDAWAAQLGHTIRWSVIGETHQA